MAATNRYGLSRAIPADVKRLVRQQCGFGCVSCGCLIYDYEHFAPPWSDAQHHDPDGIALLCPTCHSRKERGRDTTERIAQLRHSSTLRADPRDVFLPATDDFVVRLGGITAHRPKSVLRIHGEDLLTIREPEEVGAPLRVSCRFYDDDEKLCFEIHNNEVTCSRKAWDVEQQGSLITIRSGPGKIAFRARVSPTGLDVDRLNMSYRGTKLIANSQWLGTKDHLLWFAGEIDQSDVAISLSGGEGSPYYCEPPRIPRIFFGGTIESSQIIQGCQPPGTEMYFVGSVKTLICDGDENMHLIVGHPRDGDISWQLVSDFAFQYHDQGDLLLGLGCKTHSLKLVKHRASPRPHARGSSLRVSKYRED